MRQLLQLCLIFHSCILLGQSQLQFDKLQLPNNSRCRAIIQDNQGFIWFGTDYGLLRYDGYEFKEFRENPNDSLSLQSGAVDNIVQDHQGFIWLSSSGNGLYKLDPVTECFFLYDEVPEDSTALRNQNIGFILADSSNRLWVGNENGGGLHLYDPINNNFERFYNNTGLNQHLSNSISTIFEFKPGIFWLITKAGHFEFDHETRAWKLIDANPRYGLYKPFYRDYQGRIWTGDPKLKVFSEETGEFIPYHFKNTDYTPHVMGGINGDGQGRLFLSTYSRSASLDDGTGGLAVLDLKSATFYVNTPNIKDPNTLEQGSVSSEIYDRSGILWARHAVMTNGNIIEKYDHRKVIKHHLDFLPKVKHSIDLIVNAIRIDKNNPNTIWLGTMNSGLLKFNLENGTSQQILYDVNNPGPGFPYAIFSIFQDRFGVLWVGTWSQGLYKLDPQTGKWKNYKRAFEKYGLPRGPIFSLSEDSDDNLWVGGFGNNLSKLKLGPGKGFQREIIKFRRIAITPQMQMGGFNNIVEDQFRNVWFSTGNGLFRYNKKSDDFDGYLETESLINVFIDRSHNLWAGTFSGIFKAENIHQFTNKTELEFKKVDIAPEFIGRFVAFVYEDQDGFLWGGADHRVLKFHPDTKDYKIFNEEDRVLTEGMLAADGANGLMVVSGNNGFISFYPDSLKENTFTPPIVFTDFQIANRSVTPNDSLAGKPVLTKVVNHTDQITLPYGQNFSFKFAALNFTNTSKNLYQYKMEGFDYDWSPPSTTRTATYTNLWEGDYTFRVKGSNNDGVWNEKGASIQITITPPMWRTWWAYSLYVIAFLGILTSFFRFFIIRERLKGDLKMEHLELEKVIEMDSMKTQFFANVSHEFRTPLTLILGPLKQMKQGTFKGDVDAVINVMIRNSKRLLHLINQLLDFSKLEAGGMKLKASEGNLVAFVRTLFAAFESAAQSRGIKYILETNVESLMVYYDADKLEKIIINLLSNAFKFTEEGSVSLYINHRVEDSAVDQGHGVLELQIKDTGIGIDEEKLPHVFDRFFQVDSSYTRVQEGTGIGLALTKQLVELHYGSISVSSKEGRGSTFTIHLPLGNSHLGKDEMVIRAGYHQVEATPLESLPEDLDMPTNGEEENVELPLILVVEDNEDMRRYLQTALTNDFRLEEASNGIRGWESAIQNIPDLVVSDVMMPLMDGHELCEKLKTDQRTCHIPVILLTARAGEKAKLEGLETGADDYITKPFSADELKVRVKNLIEIRKKLSERYSKDISLQPKDIAITSLDEQFLEKVMEIVEEHRTNTEFGAEDFAREMGMSRSQMHRKLVALTGQTTSDFIRSYRLNYARQLIEKNFGNMTQVAYESGFSSPSYFTVCFKKQFGVSPKEFEKQIG